MAGIKSTKFSRRNVLQAAGFGGVMAALSIVLAHGKQEDAGAFSWDMLREQARNLAQTAYVPPDKAVADALAGLNYDQYRNINFRYDRALWKEEPFPFELQLFHAGYLYRHPVGVHIVEKGQAARLVYDRSLFDFGPAESRVPIPDNAGYSGFRLHAPVSRPDVYEEFAVFQGASYFRSRAKDQIYGLSARGLAIDTVQPAGEEFPAFRAFWIEKPSAGAARVVVYALLDSRSVSGAFKFTISRADDTVMDVSCELHPRRVLTHAGIAPFSSMFFFSPADQTLWDEFRPRVHDSDGLLIYTSGGDWIWRPLVTAGHILYSAFSDQSPRGFGLMQRERRYDAYQDLNAEYEKRPAAWVEPLSDWGEGSVDLIELPTNNEYADNIVAFWRPKEALQPGTAYHYDYRLSWTGRGFLDGSVAKVAQTLVGKGLSQDSRYFVIDFAGGDLFPEASDEFWDYDVTASNGLVWAYSQTANPYVGGKRIAIEYRPDGNKTADLTFQISQFGKALTERWVYRWAP